MAAVKREVFYFILLIVIGSLAGVLPGFRTLAIIGSVGFGLVFYIKAQKWFLVQDRIILAYVIAHFSFVVTCFAMLRAASVLTVELIEGFSFVTGSFGILLVVYVLKLRKDSSEKQVKDSLMMLVIKILLILALPCLFVGKSIPVFD